MASGEFWKPSGEGVSFRGGIGLIRASQERFLEAERAASVHVDTNGFRGVMADEIAEWQKRNLGRAFGYHSRIYTDGYVFNYIGTERFHGVMYALPLTDSVVQGADKQVLLVAPDYDQGRYVVISPTVTISRNPKTVQKINSIFLRRFNSLFTPNSSPYINPPWGAITSNPFDHFLQHPVDMSVNVVAILRGDDREVALKQAIDVAEKDRIRRNISGNPVTLLENFGDEEIDFLDTLSSKFGQIVGPIDDAINDVDH